MAHLPPWPIINKYCYRNIWTARHRALQPHKAERDFLRDYLALLMNRGYIFCFEHTVVSNVLWFIGFTQVTYELLTKNLFGTKQGPTTK